MSGTGVDPCAFSRSMELLSEVTNDGDVCDRLEELAREARVFAVFRDVFPDDFAKLDSRSLKRQGETRAGVLACVELVSDRLFPLFAEAIEECGLGGVPFISFVDHENDWYQPWDLPSALRLALYLNHADIDDPGEMLDSLGLERKDAARVPVPEDPGSLAYDIDAALGREPRVLRRLGSIALIPARDTGLVFYDGCCMCGGCDSVEWSVENITALTAQYRDACELTDAVRELSGWIDADPPHRVAHAVRAWNRAVERERSRHARPETDAA